MREKRLAVSSARLAGGKGRIAKFLPHVLATRAGSVAAHDDVPRPPKPRAEDMRSGDPPTKASLYQKGLHTDRSIDTQV